MDKYTIVKKWLKKFSPKNNVMYSIESDSAWTNKVSDKFQVHVLSFKSVSHNFILLVIIDGF